jgi:iodotyrosine deiodinase
MMDAPIEVGTTIVPWQPLAESIRISEDFYLKAQQRRSIRKFSSTPIEREVVINAIRSAGTAPSGANRQPWFFAVITSPSIKRKIREAAESVEREFYNGKAPEEWLRDLKPFGTTHLKPYLTEAPVLIAVFTRNETLNENGDSKKTYYPIESTGLAVGILLTSLHNSGLATLTHTPRPMNFLNNVLGLDRSYRPFMIVVAGHPELPVRVPDLTRKPLEEILAEY